MRVSLALRRDGRSRVTFRARLRSRWLGFVRKRYARALKAAKDHETVELERLACTIDRLEQAARIGSSAAAQRLASMAMDTLGAERRRLAGEASDRLRSMNIRYRY